MVSVEWFLISVAVYSALRTPDVVTTALLAQHVDIHKHESNFLMLPLIKSLGFWATMILTWVLFAALIGVLDSLYLLFPGVPIVAVLLGSGHILAAFNNAELYFRGKHFGFDSLEEASQRVGRLMRGLPSLRKIWVATQIDFFRIGVGFYSLGAIISLYFSAHSSPPMNASFLALGLVMVFGLMAFFIAIAVLSYITVNRWSNMEETASDPKDITTVRIPTLRAVQAVEDAVRQNREYVEIPIAGHDESGGE